MDSTTLISFMLQTHPTVNSVHLLGSWDNFQKSYPMERDSRKGRGQWHGCYSFKDIICDGDVGSNTKRSGGLKMGHEYWYYYELDDGTETYNRSLPSTTHCPYMPGQTLNTLWVPIEVKAPRIRSASTSSIASAFMTMNPDDKYITPRAPPPPPTLSLPRLNTSPAILDPPTTTKSISPKTPKLPSPWSPRNLFGLKTPMSSCERKQRLNIRIPLRSEEGDVNISSPTLLSHTGIHFPPTPKTATMPGTMSSQSSQDKSWAPEILAARLRNRKSENALSTLIIPDEITEEEEDDENFATVEMAEVATMLSPPPTAIRHIEFPTLRKNRSTLSSESSDEDRYSRYLPLHRKLGKSQSSPSIRTPPARPPPPPPARADTDVQGIARPQLLRSRFSVDTIDCAISDDDADQSQSHAEHASIYASDEEYTSDFDDEQCHDHGRDDAEHDSPLLEEVPEISNRFSYALPGALGSDLTLSKFSTYSSDSRRETFGLGIDVGVHEAQGQSVLGNFLGEMGYLGNVIHQ